MTDTSVLVTGATGYIAGHTIEELLTRGYAVRGTVRDLETASVDHLHAIAKRTGGSLKLVQARLEEDRGWADAVNGSEYVLHIASPNPSVPPRNEDEVIRPAVDGTLRVLRAAADSGTVRRVVVTSSSEAVNFGHKPGAKPIYTEADWSEIKNIGPYPKSKVLAEQAAWEFAGSHQIELASVNPGLVVGPVQYPGRPASLEPVRKLLAREMPGVPRFDFAVVDIRDVVTAHLLAMEHPAAAGNRYILVSEHMWLGDIAQVLSEHLRPRGWRIPTRPLPYPLVWATARFDKSVRMVLDEYRDRFELSAAKAARELGWTTRPARQSIIDAADSLIEQGVVRARAAARTASNATAAHDASPN